MDPELTARLSDARPPSLYELQSYVRQYSQHPVRLYQVAQLIRKHKMHRLHPRLTWLQPAVLYRACFLLLPTYAPPVLALARGLMANDFFETERMCLAIFDVPTFDPATGAHRLDHGTTLEAFGIVARQYPMAIKARAEDTFHRLQQESVRRSQAMAERVLRILESGELAAPGKVHAEAGLEAARVLARCLAVQGPVTDVRASYEAYGRGFRLALRPEIARHVQAKDRQELADAMALVRYYFPHRKDAGGRGEEARWAEVVRQAFAQEALVRAIPRAPTAHPRQGKIRVGYVSPDFRSTAVGWFLTPLLSRFDRSRFEVYVYNNHTGELHADPARVMFRGMPVYWFESGKFTEETFVDVLHSHEIDVLVDLLCYHRPTLLARRPVPHILNYLGFPGRSHIPGVSGRVVDAVTDPPELDCWRDAADEELRAADEGLRAADEELRAADESAGSAGLRGSEAAPSSPNAAGCSPPAAPSSPPAAPSSPPAAPSSPPAAPSSPDAAESRLVAAAHAEPLIRLPRCFVCFSPMACYAPYPIAFRPAAAPGTLRIGIFNKSAKFVPSVVSAWREILERRPGAEMWFKRDERYMDPDVWESFRDLFGPRLRGRVRGFPFADKVGAYFDYHNQIDLALDTWPYSGTTTTCSALYMGVPVLTVCGREHAERVSESILVHAGLEQWVLGRGSPPPPADDDPNAMPHREAYIRAAVEWPGAETEQGAQAEQARREALREKFMATMDEAAFMRDWEEMLERVVGRKAEPDDQ
jgi:hypothetical protein